jgi:hypothetical protein
MGKFLKYEDSNWRSFIIDTTAGTIKRPKRPVTAADMLGAVIQVDVVDSCIPVTVRNSSTAVVGVIFVDGTATTLTYTKATDVFTLGSTTLTNVMIDEFGREEMYI